MNSGIYKIKLALAGELFRDKPTCEYFSALKARTTYSEVYREYGSLFVNMITLIHTSDEFAT